MEKFTIQKCLSKKEKRKSDYFSFPFFENKSENNLGKYMVKFKCNNIVIILKKSFDKY